MTRRRPSVATVAVAAVALLVVAAFALAATTIWPTTVAERDVSGLFRESAAGTPDPRVTLSGLDGRAAERLTVRAERTERPEVGPVSLEVRAESAQLPPAGTDPTDAEIAAEHLEVAVEVSDFVLTRLYDRRVSRVASHLDTSLVGGREHTAQLTVDPSGDHPGGDVLLDLSVTDSGAVLTPREPTLGLPELTLPPTVLPFDVGLDEAVVTAGTIRLEGSRAAATVRPVEITATG